MLKRTPTLRTSIPYLRLHLNDSLCFRFVKASTTMTYMALLPTPSLRVILHRAVGLVRNLGRRGGGTKISLFLLPLQIPQLRLKPLDLLG